MLLRCPLNLIMRQPRADIGFDLETHVARQRGLSFPRWERSQLVVSVPTSRMFVA